MAVNVALQNPSSGEIKFIKVGFSWVLFLFSNVFGIPLFKRKLYRWGLAVLAVNIAAIFVPLMVSRNAGVAYQLMTFVGQIVIMFVLGFKGNEITAKNFLAQSWQFAEPQSEAVRYAKMRWQIFDGSSGVSTATVRQTAAPVP